VELMLTRRLGDVGKKIHSGRSRNDQVLVDLKLFIRAQLKSVAEAVERLFHVLISQSNRYKDVLMPGYTHLQIAMPSSFGLWFGAYAESLVDDMMFLQAAYKTCNRNPLGSAAGYGSSFPLDREMTTRLLGFDSMNYNVVYAQMGRGKVVQKKVGSWTVKASVVENPLAPIYRTVLASEILTAADSVDEIVAKIRAEAESAFKLRVKMLDFPIGVEELSVVRGALVTDHRIDLQTSARAVNETTQQERVEGDETEEEQSDRADRLSYLRDPSLPGEERLLRYLHEKFPDRADVTVEEVRELTAPLVA
jgi:hypothetical protein